MLGDEQQLTRVTTPKPERTQGESGIIGASRVTSMEEGEVLLPQTIEPLPGPRRQEGNRGMST